MKHTFFSFFLLLPALLLAQKDSIQRPKWSLILSPLSAFNLNYPTIQLGVNFRPFRRWNFQIEYGTPIASHSKPLAVSTSTQKVPYSYYTIRSEARFIFTERARHDWYVGLEALRISDTKYNTNTYYTVGESVYGYESAKRQRTDWIIDPKIGWQWYMGKRVSLDVYGGAGIRNHYYHFSEIKNQWLSTSISPSNHFQDRSQSLYATIGAKLIIKLK